MAAAHDLSNTTNTAHRYVADTDVAVFVRALVNTRASIQSVNSCARTRSAVMQVGPVACESHHAACACTHRGTLIKADTAAVHAIAIVVREVHVVAGHLVASAGVATCALMGSSLW